VKFNNSRDCSFVNDHEHKELNIRVLDEDVGADEEVKNRINAYFYLFLLFCY
jgi:hypothetical protein